MAHEHGFIENFLILDPIHRITNIIEKTLEGKEQSATFLNATQAFVTIWHECLIYILKIHNIFDLFKLSI